MPTLTADTHREQMIRRLEAGEDYSFLGMADPYLNVVPDDSYVRLMAVREYLKLGLVLAAKGLLDGGLESADVPQEIQTLRESLCGVRGRLISWSQGSKCFDANLSLLERRGVNANSIRADWDAHRARYQWFRDANDMDQVRLRTEEGMWRWIPALAHHKAVAEAQPLPEGVGSNMPGPFLFEGLDLGWYFQRVYQATKNTFLGYSCALFVVEPDPTALALVLHLHDWREIIADSRVFWFIGDGCSDRLREAWDGDLDLPWPRQAFTLSLFRPSAKPDVIDVVRDAGGRREKAIRNSFAELEARYADCDRYFWAKRLDEALCGRGKPLRILAAVSTHTTFLQYSMRDAQRAMESLGHRCVVLTEKTAHDIVGPLTFHHAIRELHPDLYFCLDHLRPEFENLIPRNLPILSWDQDQLPHVFTRENMSRVAAHDFLTGCSKAKWVMEGFNPRQFLHARLPTCPEQYSGPPLTPEEQCRYGCDVSYVSHASQTAHEFHEEQRARCADPKLATVLDVLFELLPEALRTHRVASGPVCDELLTTAAKRCGVKVPDPSVVLWVKCWYLWRLGDRMFRHEALEWVATWARQTGRRLRIYGRGWDRHPTLHEFAAGPAENGQLFCIYRASKINLQLMPAGFIHQRALDGLAAGGFFLTRLVPSDLRGRALRRLQSEIRRLGLGNTRELLKCADPTCRELLYACCDNWLKDADVGRDDLFHNLELSWELEYPDELFADFDKIVFDSPEQFAIDAGRFLGDDSARARIAERMREVVVERLAYRPTMAHFLRSMADYLAA